MTTILADWAYIRAMACRLDGETVPELVEHRKRLDAIADRLQRDDHASSPPVPQQGAEAVAEVEDGPFGKRLVWHTTDSKDLVETGSLLYTAPPLEIRLRDVKTNQEIDAMVREMKQPSDEQILRAAHQATENFVGADDYILRIARAVLALHAEPVEKMKGEGA